MADYKPTGDEIKQLRAMTGAGMLNCKNAIIEFNGDIEKAKEYLRKKGLAIVSKKASRGACEGLVYAYIHHNSKNGVLVEVNCETDFVARTSNFQELVAEIAMHIAAQPGTLGISPDDIPADALESEKEIHREQARATGKPDNVIEKIIEGKLKKFYADVCVLNQQWVKDDKKTIQDLINESVAKLGENIVLKRFARFQIGE
jgi:elongation factor Ts